MKCMFRNTFNPNWISAGNNNRNKVKVNSRKFNARRKLHNSVAGGVNQIGFFFFVFVYFIAIHLHFG